MSIGMDKKNHIESNYFKKIFSFVFIYRNLMSWENVLLYFS